MLIEDLGYRPPSLSELGGILGRKAWGKLAPTENTKTDFELPLAILSSEPLICYSGIVPNAPLGAAGLVDDGMRQKPAWFLLSPTWTLEDRELLQHIRGRAVLHRRRNPQHKLIFMCNSEEEAALLHEFGEAAFYHNKTTNTSEALFRPLANVEREFDAIYNAQLAPWKRHELTLEIERCGFLFYRGISSDNASEAALIARHAAEAPGHVFINEIGDDGLPMRLPPERVNHHLNRSAVGLCLSAKEGAMFACAEYLLAGLPVITTPNQGGRDFYLDDDYCITVPADPRAIAEGVAALKARQIPPEHIRERTLGRMQRHRERFRELIDGILAECGAPQRTDSSWPADIAVVLKWVLASEARKRILAGTQDRAGQILLGARADA